MLIGEVVGRLWASRQAAGLSGRKMLLVRTLGDRRVVVAVDGLGAGPGERVIVAHGTRVRDITVGEQVPDKDVVIAIVDDLHVEGDRGARGGRA
jgi:ethanolamine utilization protein EutN